MIGFNGDTKTEIKKRIPLLINHPLKYLFTTSENLSVHSGMDKKRLAPPSDYAIFQSYSRMALKKVARDSGLTTAAVDVLICIHTLNKETQSDVSYHLIKSRAGYATEALYKSLHSLEKSAYLIKSKVRYRASTAGAYVVRNFSSELSRMVNGTDLSYWKRLQGVEE